MKGPLRTPVHRGALSCGFYKRRPLRPPQGGARGMLWSLRKRWKGVREGARPSWASLSSQMEPSYSARGILSLDCGRGLCQLLFMDSIRKPLTSVIIPFFCRKGNQGPERESPCGQQLIARESTSVKVCTSVSVSMVPGPPREHSGQVSGRKEPPVPFCKVGDQGPEWLST